ncbi:hypothetical protein BC940DRAFT_298357 [Gongronella butleri]|nr:hypothetical protein BC940DRAFT_298357 [Gongronella butleri]
MTTIPRCGVRPKAQQPAPRLPFGYPLPSSPGQSQMVQSIQTIHCLEKQPQTYQKRIPSCDAAQPSQIFSFLFFFLKHKIMHSIALGLLCLTSLVTLTRANMAPSYPEPGTVWKENQEYEIQWNDDAAKPSMADTWKNFRIDLMTGEDENQVTLGTVAENVNPADKKIKIKAPVVEPHAPIYFFMFSNDQGEFAWTTRFAIVGADGKQKAPEKSVQPNGQKIPWGVGKLMAEPLSPVNGRVVMAASASSTSSMSGSMSSMNASMSASGSSSMISATGTVSSRVSPSLQAVASGKKAGVAKNNGISTTSVSMALVAGMMAVSMTFLA